MRVRMFGIYGMGVVAEKGRLTISSPRLNGMGILQWVMLWRGDTGSSAEWAELDFGYAGVPINEHGVGIKTSKPWTSLIDSGQDTDTGGFHTLSSPDQILNVGVGSSILTMFRDMRNRFVLNAPIWTPDQYLTVSLTPTFAGSADPGHTDIHLQGVMRVIDDVPYEVLACQHRWGLNV